MASVEVGGDRSVKWLVDVDRARYQEIKSVGRGERGHRQEGVDETDQGASFEITIKLPQLAGDRENFIQALEDAAVAARKHENQPGHPVRFSLRIEDDDRVNPPVDDQIRIRWASRGTRVRKRGKKAKR